MGAVDEFWARSLSGIVHRLIALTAFIIKRRRKSRIFARRRSSSLIFAYTFEFFACSGQLFSFMDNVDPYHYGLVKANLPEARQTSSVAGFAR